MQLGFSNPTNETILSYCGKGRWSLSSRRASLCVIATECGGKTELCATFYKHKEGLEK